MYETVVLVCNPEWMYALEIYYFMGDPGLNK